MFLPVLSGQSPAIRQGSNAGKLDQTDQSEHSPAARTYEAQTLLAGGQYAAAEQILRAVLDAIEQREARGVDAAIALDNLANAMFETGRFSEARALLAQALAILKERLGSQDLRYATVAAHLAAAEERLGFYSQAKQLLLESLGVAKRAASDHFLEADIEDNLGRISIAQGQYLQAAEQIRAALEIFESVDPMAFRRRFETRADRIAAALSDLACAIARSGQIAEATAFAERAKVSLDLPSGPSPRTVIKVFTILGWLYAMSGRAQEAEALMQQSLSMAEVSYGLHDPSLVPVLVTYATVDRCLNRKRAARALEERARSIQANASEKDYSDLTISIESLLLGATRKK